VFEYLIAQLPRWWWKETIQPGLAATLVTGISTQILLGVLEVGQKPSGEWRVGGVNWKLCSTESGGRVMSENTLAEAQQRRWKARA
jgi:hypothetical protein